ncbi:MAG TPA: hypothetical protein VFX45_06105 [Solirubrobacterales bacterium]|nr:hypothetical protein [Solirubrobacterales bacterium]
MYARVVRWEGGDAKALEDSAAQIREQSADGPPPGVPAKEFFLLQDTAAGKAVAIMLFESEEDYDQGHETLESMSPPGDGMGTRVSVEKMELAVHVEA